MPEIEVEAVTVDLGGEAEVAAEEIVGGADPADAPDAADPAKSSDPETGATPDPRPWKPVVTRWRLPIAAATVFLEVGTLVRLGPHWSTIPVLAFAATAVALAVIDFAVLRLPNALTGPTAIAVVVAAVVQAVAEHDMRLLLTEAEGALAVGLFYAFLHLLSRGGLGLGDVKVGALAGLVLAPRGWIHIFDATLLAYVVTLVIALAMLSRGRKRYPYGPGLIAGAVVVLLAAG